MDTTVRIEYMLVSDSGDAVVQNWTTIHGSVINNPNDYVPRALSVKKGMGMFHTARVRVVGEQSNRIVDIIQ